MSKTKKSFILAGSIIGIVEAVCLIFLGLIFLLVMFTIEGIDTSLLLEESTIQLTSEEIENLIFILQVVYGVLGASMIVMGPLMLTASIVTLNQRNKAVAKKGPIITLLVFSILCGNIITAGFMITCLCLKDKNAIELVEEAMKNQ